MDGRAQAAYDHDTYKKWTYIFSGGPTVRNAALSRRDLTRADYTKIGNWITEQLELYDVWIVLMPRLQVQNKDYNTFVRGIESKGRWQPVYIDDSQYLYVNTKSDKGKKLLNRVLNEQAVFPDEFSRHLSVGRLWLYFNDRERSLRGFEYLKKAFNMSPSGTSMRILLSGLNFAHIKPRVHPFIEVYLKNFIDNKDSYRKKSGYLKKLHAAQIGAASLAARYRRANPEKSELYKTLLKEYAVEYSTMQRKVKW